MKSFAEKGNIPKETVYSGAGLGNMSGQECTLSRGKLSGGKLSGGNLSFLDACLAGELVRGEVVQRGTCPGGSCPVYIKENVHS